MATAAGSSNDVRSIEDVMQCQMDRLDEMQKLDGEVIGLNSAYIEILERITNKLDLLATLADEIETDTRVHPDSMDDLLRRRFDLLNQSALMNRYMCTKALFTSAIQSIKAMNQFGGDYVAPGIAPYQLNQPTSDSTGNDLQALQGVGDTDTAGIIAHPLHQSTSDSTENDLQALQGVGDTHAEEDSDATVSARLDDSNVSIMDDEVANISGPSNPILPQSLHAPSTIQIEEEEMEKHDSIEGEEIRIENDHEDEEMMEEMHEEKPEEPCGNGVMTGSEKIELGRDCDGFQSVADSIKSIESIASVGQKKRKKKKKKRSKSSEQRHRNREAGKMKNMLDKHFKRSLDTPKRINSNEETQQDGVKTSTPIVKHIEVVTLSDEEPIRPIKISRIDDDEIFERPFESRFIPVPKAPPMEDYENYHREKEAIEEIKSEIEKSSISGSSQVLANIIHPLNTRPSIPQSVPLPLPPPPPRTTPPPPYSVLPPPVTSPSLSLSLGRGPGFIAAEMPEAPKTPSNWSQLNKELQEKEDPDSSLGEKSMIIESPEAIVNEEREKEKEDKKKEDNKKIRKDSRCDSRGSLKELLQEEIRLRESGKFSPERRGRSRSLSYSPRRERSRSRGRSRSRSRSRDIKDWRSPWKGSSNRFRYGHQRPRYQRWSRSRTRSRSRSRSRHRSRSRSLSRDSRRSRSRSISRDRNDDWRRSRSRSRHRSNSRDRNNSRYRSISRSRSRSLSRGRRSLSRGRRSLSRGRRSITPLTPDGREARSPMPRAYAKFRNRSNERKEKKKNEKDNVKEDKIVIEEDVPSPSMDMINQKVSSPLTPSSSLSIPLPVPPPIFPSSFIKSIPSRPPLHSTSSSPSIFIPPPPIIIPSKPPPLKITIPSTLSISIKNLRPITPSSSQSIPVSSSALPPSNEKKNDEKMEGIQGKSQDAARRTSSSDMSLEGNTLSEGSNGRRQSIKMGDELILDIPTPPLSNPSSMEQRKWNVGEEFQGPMLSHSPLPPPPPPPSLSITNQSNQMASPTDPSTSRFPSSSTPSPVCTPGLPQSIIGGIRPISGRSVSGPYPLHSMQHQQFYPNGAPLHPYGPPNGWMNHDPQWQQQYYHHYNQDSGGMMGGYGHPPLHAIHSSPIAQGSVADTHDRFMQAMRVLPSPSNPPPDWAQMARDHANQQIHMNNVPPPPSLLGPQVHMMGGHHPHYGTPQAGRGGSRFRGGGGGKGRRW